MHGPRPLTIFFYIGSNETTVNLCLSSLFEFMKCPGPPELLGGALNLLLKLDKFEKSSEVLEMVLEPNGICSCEYCKSQ